MTLHCIVEKSIHTVLLFPEFMPTQWSHWNEWAGFVFLTQNLSEDSFRWGKKKKTGELRSQDNDRIVCLSSGLCLQLCFCNPGCFETVFCVVMWSPLAIQLSLCSILPGDSMQKHNIKSLTAVTLAPLSHNNMCNTRAAATNCCWILERGLLRHWPSFSQS